MGTRQRLAVPKLESFFWMASMEHRYSYPGLRHLAIRAPSAILLRTRKSNWVKQRYGRETCSFSAKQERKEERQAERGEGVQAAWTWRVSGT